MSELAKKEKGNKKFGTKIQPYLYLLPFAIGVIVFTLYPIANVVLISFKENFNYINKTFTGFGFGNYAYILKDPYFAQAFKNTFSYVFIVIPISTCRYVTKQKAKRIIWWSTTTCCDCSCFN